MSVFDGARSRTLTIHSSAIPLVLGQPALEPVRLTGRERINSLFEYELLLKTPDALNIGASGAADFDLNAFIAAVATTVCTRPDWASQEPKLAEDQCHPPVTVIEPASSPNRPSTSGGYTAVTDIP